MRLAQASDTAKVLKANVAHIEKQIEALLDRIVDSGNATVIDKKRITKLEREKVLTQEKLEANGKPRLTLEESFEHALAFLSSPWNLWKFGPDRQKDGAQTGVFGAAGILPESGTSNT